MFISRKRLERIERDIERLDEWRERTESRIRVAERATEMYDQSPHTQGFPRKQTTLKSVVFGILDSLKLKVIVTEVQPSETKLEPSA